MEISASTSTGVRGPENGAQADKLKEVCRDFESIFLELVLRAMRDTVPEGGLVDGGNAEDIYRSMLDSEYAKVMAQEQGIGLATRMEQQLLGQREAGVGNINTQIQTIRGEKAYIQGAALSQDVKQAKID